MKHARVYLVGPELPTAERCSIAEMLNSPDDPTCSVARARVAPGVTTQRHRLRDVTERYLVLEGTGRAEIGDGPPIELAVGMAVTIPPDVSQRVTNTSPTDLVFLCLCTPRFTPSCYQALE